MSGSYYNEHDPKAAAWLRQLIANNVIPAGEVDERSIEDVRPSDLRGFRQCHFFAGIGGWAEALRIAGWSADRSVWTGSCPCQPFSSAGEGAGTTDERHLWPSWFYLIEECRPSVLFGEQVDAAVKHGWLDLVHSDMEGIGYAYAPVIVPAASIGAPHGRHRIWFVAESEGKQPHGRNEARRGWHESADSGSACWLEHADMPNDDSGASSGQQQIHAERDASTSALEHASIEQARISRLAWERRKTGGFWADADWIPCSDAKWRPIEPGTFPLAHGVQARMDKLRGYGNAIVPQVAAQFIGAYVATSS